MENFIKKFKNIGKKKKIIILGLIIVASIVVIFSFVLISNNNLKDIKNTDTIEKVTNQKDKKKTEDKNNNIRLDANENTTTDNNKNNISNNKQEKKANETSNFDINTKENKTTNQENTKNSKNEKIEATKSYYCSSPYTLNGTKCYYNDKQPALYRYVCNSGTLNGSVCTNTSTIVFSNYSNVAYEQCVSLSGSGHHAQCLCNNSGGTYDGSKCYKRVITTTNAIKNYYCTNGYTLSGTYCIYNNEIDAPFNLTCPSGYILKGTYCEK